MNPASIKSALESFSARLGVRGGDAIVIAGAAAYLRGLRDTLTDIDFINPALPYFVKGTEAGFEMDGGPGVDLPPEALGYSLLHGMKVQTLPAMICFYDALNRPKDKEKIQMLTKLMAKKNPGKVEKGTVRHMMPRAKSTFSRQWHKQQRELGKSKIRSSDLQRDTSDEFKALLRSMPGQRIVDLVDRAKDTYIWQRLSESNKPSDRRDFQAYVLSRDLPDAMYWIDNEMQDRINRAWMRNEAAKKYIDWDRVKARSWWGSPLTVNWAAAFGEATFEAGWPPVKEYDTYCIERLPVPFPFRRDQVVEVLDACLFRHSTDDASTLIALIRLEDGSWGVVRLICPDDSTNDFASAVLGPTLDSVLDRMSEDELLALGYNDVRRLAATIMNPRTGERYS